MPHADESADDSGSDPRIDPLLVECSCGHTMDSVWVSPRAKYSGLQFLMHVFVGVSGGRPERIEWACRQCGDILAQSRDPELILHYRHE